MKRLKNIGAFAAFAFFILLTVAQNASAAPLIYTVDRTDDTGGTACTAAANDCTLRGAIAAANGATINFDATLFATTQTIDLTNGQLTISASMTITGTTADKLRIRNTAVPSTTSRVFLISSGITVSLSGMTITGGNVSGGGSGGGINNNGGTTTVTNCVIDGNMTTGFGGGIRNSSSGSLTLTGSTVSNNTSGGDSGGGGIDNSGTLTITNSTVSGNKITTTNVGNGGGILFFGGTATITNSTITNNSTGGNTGASGIYNNSGAVTLKNTIVAGNVNNATQPDISGAFTSSGFNLIGNPGAATGLIASDLSGGSALPLNPRLSPLGNYGGGTLSHALLQAGTSPASPAINAGNATGAPAADQRGATRTAPVDIGAYEVVAAFVAQLPIAKLSTVYNQTITPESGAFIYTISSISQPPPGTTLQNGVAAPVSSKSDETGRDAPAAPQAGRYSITGTPTTAGTYPFTITATNTANQFSVNYSITVAAPTAASVTISGRVSTEDGRGLTNAIVTLTDSNGVTRTARTTTFGYYRFDEVAGGQTYIVEIQSKRFTFAPQVVMVTEDTNNLNFTAQ